MARGLPFSSIFYTTTTNYSAQDTPPPPPTSTTTAPPPAAWMWPSCKHPRTQSFRAPPSNKTVASSVFLDSSAESSSSFVNDSSSARHADCGASASSDSPSSTAGSDEATASAAAAAAADDMADTIVRGLRSDDRILFEPRAPSSSILEKKPAPSQTTTRRDATATGGQAAPTFVEGVAVSVESADPYRDFRASMAEMVAAASGAGDCWEWLERMLAWYLGANGKDTHPAIITAFVDLVACMAGGGAGGASSSSRVSSFTLAGSEEPAESSSAGHCAFRRT